MTDEIIPEKKEEQPVSLEKDKQGKKKEGSFVYIALVMIASLMIATFWDKIPYLKDIIHGALDPTAGALLTLNLTAGMLIIVFILTLITTLIQKYTTDQKTLRELQAEQKLLQEEMKKFKDHPEKLAEISKRQFELFPKTFKLTSRGMLFTGIPFILFYRWFFDIFTAMGDPVFLGFLNWFWFYFISMMVFSIFLRKWLKVV